MSDDVVFFADVLGFSSALLAGRHDLASEALDDVTVLFSDQDEIARFLQIGSPWTARYGLSDSILLLAGDAVETCRAASRFFFRLAYLNHAKPHQAMLMRGAIARGTVERRPPIFPESGKENVVGEAIVRAAALEKCGLKGPRILLDSAVADVAARALPDAIDSSAGAPELLWLLPSINDADIFMLKAVAGAAFELFVSNSSDEATPHFLAYLDLVLRSLERMLGSSPEEAKGVIASISVDRSRERIQQLLLLRSPAEAKVLERLNRIAEGV